MTQKLTNRLAAIASLVPEGALLCDVGTDHAYLPIALVQRNAVRAALASDVRELPCERARWNIAALGLSERIGVVRADGLCGLGDFVPDCIVVAGMGGELIARIIGASALPAASNVTLILQPMTRAGALREFLLSGGFEITGELLARDDRIYQIITARYDGVQRTASPPELLLGMREARRSPELFGEFARRQCEQLHRIIESKEKNGSSASSERALLTSLEAEQNNDKGVGLP